MKLCAENSRIVNRCGNGFVSVDESSQESSCTEESDLETTVSSMDRELSADYLTRCKVVLKNLNLVDLNFSTDNDKMPLIKRKCLPKDPDSFSYDSLGGSEKNLMGMLDCSVSLMRLPRYISDAGGINYKTFMKRHGKDFKALRKNRLDPVKSYKFLDAPYKCYYCNYACSVKHKLRRHIKNNHLVEKRHKCAVCPYSCNRKNIFDRHVSLNHKKIEPFKGTPYDFNGFSDTDLGKAVGEKLVSYKCDLCKFKCKKKSTLLKHKKSLHRNGTFIDKKSKNSLSTDVNRAAVKVTPFKCVVCDLCLTTKFSLKNHILTVHCGEKPHRCPYCDVRTTRRGGLTRHITLVHNAEKQFKCNFCSYTSSSVGSVSRHMGGFHSDKKSVVCTKCGAKFFDNDYLSKHTDKVHNKIRARMTEFARNLDL